eukprot:6194424-Pleurochrysis_carterae.AAC.2
MLLPDESVDAGCGQRGAAVSHVQSVFARIAYNFIMIAVPEVLLMGPFLLHGPRSVNALHQRQFDLRLGPTSFTH